MIYDVLPFMLCTFFKGLFLNSCTFFKGLFALFCHFSKGLSVAKIQKYFQLYFEIILEGGLFKEI